MKTGKIVIAIMSMVMGSLVFSQGHDHGSSTKRSMDKDMQSMSPGHMMVNLPSMQCGMCLDNIETGLFGMEGIHSVKVDIDNKMGHINYDPEKVSEGDIEQSIAKLGYWANDVPADQKAYTQLDGCCQMSDGEYKQLTKASMHNSESPHKMGKESMDSHMKHGDMKKMEMDDTGSSSGCCEEQ